ncbi:hypothetical protein BH11PSE7_BH11PSE7_17830 [soil metagenome]
MPLVESFVSLTLHLLDSGNLPLPAGVKLIKPSSGAVLEFLGA